MDRHFLYLITILICFLRLCVGKFLRHPEFYMCKRKRIATMMVGHFPWCLWESLSREQSTWHERSRRCFWASASEPGAKASAVVTEGGTASPGAADQLSHILPPLTCLLSVPLVALRIVVKFSFFFWSRSWKMWYFQKQSRWKTLSLKTLILRFKIFTRACRILRMFESKH